MMSSLSPHAPPPSAAASPSRQHVYSREAPLGRSRSEPHVVRNRASLPLRSFSPERSPYLYSSVTPSGCFTVGSPTRSAQLKQLREGKAVCPATAPPPLDAHARRGFNVFDQQLLSERRRALRAYQQHILEPAHREALLEELLVASPHQFSGELAQLRAKSGESSVAHTQQQQLGDACESTRGGSSSLLPRTPVASSSSRGTPCRTPISTLSWSPDISAVRPSSGTSYVPASRVTPLSHASALLGTPHSPSRQQPHRPCAGGPPTPLSLYASTHTSVRHGGAAVRADDASVDSRNACVDDACTRPPMPRRDTAAMPRQSSTAQCESQLCECASASAAPTAPRTCAGPLQPPKHPLGGAHRRQRHAVPTALSPRCVRSSSLPLSGYGRAAWGTSLRSNCSVAQSSPTCTRPATSTARWGIAALCPSMYVPITKLTLTT